MIILMTKSLSNSGRADIAIHLRSFMVLGLGSSAILTHEQG